jgi:phage shock protein E
MARILFIVAALVVAYFIYTRIVGGGKAPADKTREKIAAGATVVDVRSPAEFQTGAYPGAVNIPLDTLSARMVGLSKNTPVIVYCASGMRSSAAAKILKEAGFIDVTNGGGLSSMPK